MKWDESNDNESLPLVKRNRLIYKATENDGVVGYKPEEYGVHPTVTPKKAALWSSLAWIVVLGTATAAMVVFLMTLPGAVALPMYFIPAVLFLLLLSYCKKAYTEVRARKLRQDRGLPEPIE